MTLALTVTVTVTFLTLALTGSSYGNCRADVEQVYYAYVEQGFNYEIVAFLPWVEFPVFFKHKT